MTEVGNLEAKSFGLHVFTVKKREMLLQWIFKIQCYRVLVNNVLYRKTVLHPLVIIYVMRTKVIFSPLLVSKLIAFKICKEKRNSQ